MIKDKKNKQIEKSKKESSLKLDIPSLSQDCLDVCGCSEAIYTNIGIEL